MTSEQSTEPVNLDAVRKRRGTAGMRVDELRVHFDNLHRRHVYKCCQDLAGVLTLTMIEAQASQMIARDEGVEPVEAFSAFVEKDMRFLDTALSATFAVAQEGRTLNLGGLNLGWFCRDLGFKLGPFGTMSLYQARTLMDHHRTVSERVFDEIEAGTFTERAGSMVAVQPKEPKDLAIGNSFYVLSALSRILAEPQMRGDGSTTPGLWSYYHIYQGGTDEVRGKFIQNKASDVVSGHEHSGPEGFAERLVELGVINEDDKRLILGQEVTEGASNLLAFPRPGKR